MLLITSNDYFITSNGYLITSNGVLTVSAQGDWLTLCCDKHERVFRFLERFATSAILIIHVKVFVRLIACASNPDPVIDKRVLLKLN